MKRFLINTPEALYEELRRIAYERRTSIAGLVRTAVEEWIKKSQKEEGKMKFYNTDERYGEAGPFEAKSKEELVTGMLPTFKVWAEESWNKDGEGDYDQYISEAIDLMVTEFDAALEEVREDEG